MNFYENHHFWVNIINLVNKWWFGQQKVNILIIHQNVQNLTADPNSVNKMWFGQQKVNKHIIHQKSAYLLRQLTGGWVCFCTWRFLWMHPKRLSKGNWWVGWLFYLTFFLNSSKTIIFEIYLDLPLLNAFLKEKRDWGRRAPALRPSSQYIPGQEK